MITFLPNDRGEASCLPTSWDKRRKMILLPASHGPTWDLVGMRRGGDSADPVLVLNSQSLGHGDQLEPLGKRGVVMREPT